MKAEYRYGRKRKDRQLAAKVRNELPTPEQAKIPPLQCTRHDSFIGGRPSAVLLACPLPSVNVLQSGNDGLVLNDQAMRKTVITLPDGRYCIYYTFER